jgi:hypothetical protein
MAVVYRIYANTGAGDPIDWEAPVATVSGLTWNTPALAFSTDWSFGMRPYDDVLMLEYQGIDATTRVIVGPNGEDLTDRPPPVQNVIVTGAEGLALNVAWSFGVVNSGTYSFVRPTGFKVWHAVAPGPIDYDDPPSVTVPYAVGQINYSATITGLTAGTDYVIGVRSYGVLSDDGSVDVVLATVDGTAPSAPQSLVATAGIWEDP